MPANDIQVGGSHYRGTGERLLQHWDLMILLNEGYFSSVITKYTERHDKKNGRIDLEKAHHYATKWIESEQIYTDFERRIPRPWYGFWFGAKERMREDERHRRLRIVNTYADDAGLDWHQTLIFRHTLVDIYPQPKSLLASINALMEYHYGGKSEDLSRILNPNPESERMIPRPGTPEDGGHHARDGFGDSI